MRSEAGGATETVCSAGRWCCAGLAVALLVACTPDAGHGPTTGPPRATATGPEPEAVHPQTGVPGDAVSVGRQASPGLSRLTSQMLARAALQGELACSFQDDAGDVLLHAMGVVASDLPAQGIVHADGEVVPVLAPGGFNAMVGGAQFSGPDMRVAIALRGPALGGGESPPRPATLTWHRAAGPDVAVAGVWQCGP